MTLTDSNWFNVRVREGDGDGEKIRKRELKECRGAVVYVKGLDLSGGEYPRGGLRITKKKCERKRVQDQ